MSKELYLTRGMFGDKIAKLGEAEEFREVLKIAEKWRKNKTLPADVDQTILDTIVDSDYAIITFAENNASIAIDIGDYTYFLTITNVTKHECEEVLYAHN